MERQDFIRMCQKASFKTDMVGGWQFVRWNDDELVAWRGAKFVPIDYRFGFQKGEATHLAILHDLRANAEYAVRLAEVARISPRSHENENSEKVYRIKNNRLTEAQRG